MLVESFGSRSLDAVRSGTFDNHSRKGANLAGIADSRGTGPDIPALLIGARDGDAGSIGELLQNYRNYLTLLATMQLQRRLKPRVSPSDIVQETMLRAHRHFAQFRGQTERELLAWLRQILISNLARFVEHHVLAEKRDIRREVSIERDSQAIAETSTRLRSSLRAGGPTPSAAVQEREEAVLLADRLAELPLHYREVLVLRNMRGLAFEEVAAQLQRPIGATRMLWLRAITKLREVYRQAGQQDA